MSGFFCYSIEDCRTLYSIQTKVLNFLEQNPLLYFCVNLSSVYDLSFIQKNLQQINSEE